MDQLAKEDIYRHLLLHGPMVTQLHNITVAVLTLTSTGHTPYQIIWDRTSSDSNQQYSKKDGHVRNDVDNLWDGEGCDKTSTCELNHKRYFCKHLNYT